MLKKLMKYDLVWINKFMLIYFTISLIVCTITRISSYFTDSFIGNIIFLILRGCAISCFISCLINCVIRIWIRFKNNTYKDESYLTHTLPISKNTLYNSKIISGIISLLITLIVIVLCFLIVYLDKHMFNEIKNIFTNNDNIFIFLSLCLTVILEMIYMLYCGLIGLLIGHNSNNHRDLKSVFVGIALYFFIQLIILGIIYSIGLLNTDMNNLFSTTDIFTGNIKAVKLLVIIVNIVYIIFISGMYFIGKKIFNKGVNVE